MYAKKNNEGAWPWWKVLLAWAVLLPASWVLAGAAARACARLFLLGWGLA